ncbi:hypothetical protein AXF42_Ash005863 [Apostasia shenzhenica]|uniref:Uncharacterized protein n=1 Tax=Apostasia shenzhenica TaxID=1088818 RepID=A0A2I0BCK8_9ASPA|nr:hypothetical protein AXF42_Ash005863 [Apostasia shenzhenica]
MASAASAKRALLADDVPWRASPAGKKPLPRIHQNPVLRLPQNATSSYALTVMKVFVTHPNPIGDGFATEARLESAGPECIVPGQVTPVRILGLKIWPIDVNLKFMEPVGRELQALGKVKLNFPFNLWGRQCFVSLMYQRHCAIGFCHIVKIYYLLIN